MKKNVLSFFTALVALFTVSNSAIAASSDWQQTHGARLRLLSQVIPDKNDILRAVIEVELEPGWKTYWREPGSSGIPPYFDFSKSKHVENTYVYYPVPIMINDGGEIYPGYKDKVSFPIDIKVENGTEISFLKVDIFLGVCHNICVPFSVQIDLDLTKAPTSSDEMSLIQSARFNLPGKADNDLNLASIDYDMTMNVINFELTLPAFYPQNIQPEMFIQNPEKWQITQPRRIKTQNGKILFRSDILVRPDTDNLHEKQLYVLLKLGQHAVETLTDLSLD